MYTLWSIYIGYIWHRRGIIIIRHIRKGLYIVYGIMSNQQVVLVYGDSNTFGFDPEVLIKPTISPRIPYGKERPPKIQMKSLY